MSQPLPLLWVESDPLAAARKGAALLNQWGMEAQAQGETFMVSLAGGTTPETLYREWGQSSRLDWSRVVLLFGDERCVEPHHPDSNHAMVAASLFPYLPVRPQLERMEGERPPQEGAQRYDTRLAALLNGGQPWQAALLGMGADGHTASLFPHSPALAQRARLCVEAESPAGQRHRLTLSLGALLRPRRLMVVVTGGGKAQVLAQVLEGPWMPQELPAQFLLRPEGRTQGDGPETHLVCDAAAANELSHDFLNRHLSPPPPYSG
ncbi:MAG: 6-phosphogluconolactonase [Deltaproteobacteria bacterium]|nr:6-phosphogluconolactonase [Deltaproteobacteria bacterium]